MSDQKTIKAGDVTLLLSDDLQRQFFEIGCMGLESGEDFNQLPELIRERVLGAAINMARIAHLLAMDGCWQNGGQHTRDEVGAFSMHFHTDGRVTTTPLCDPSDTPTP